MPAARIHVGAAVDDVVGLTIPVFTKKRKKILVWWPTAEYCGVREGSTVTQYNLLVGEFDQERIKGFPAMLVALFAYFRFPCEGIIHNHYLSSYPNYHPIIDSCCKPTLRLSRRLPINRCVNALENVTIRIIEITFVTSTSDLTLMASVGRWRLYSYLLDWLKSPRNVVIPTKSDLFKLCHLVTIYLHTKPYRYMPSCLVNEAYPDC